MAPDVVAVSNCHAYCHSPNLSIIRRTCITYAVEHQRALHSKREMEQQQRSATVSRSNKVRSVEWEASDGAVWSLWNARGPHSSLWDLLVTPRRIVATDICVVRLCCVILTFVLFCVLCTFTSVFVVTSPSPLRISATNSYPSAVDRVFCYAIY